MEKVRVAQWGGKHLVYLLSMSLKLRSIFKILDFRWRSISAGNDDQIYEEVSTGRADFGVGDPTFVAQGAKRGDQTRVIAALVNTCLTYGFSHHPEIHPIKELDDLVGLRFGVYPRPSTSFHLFMT